VTGTSASLAAAAYDAMSARYAEVTGKGVDEPPLDRAMLAAFTEHVTTAGGGMVADAGLAEVGRMSRAPAENERHPRGHLLLSRA
jgi:hypothetical protein